jgi:uncharacterized repeat protein (TIGR01451 family)
LPAAWAVIDDVSVGAAHADAWVTGESATGQPGWIVAQTLRVGNRGAVAADGVVLTYTLPPELTYSAADPAPSSTSPLRWELGSLAADGPPVEIHLTTTVRAVNPARLVVSTANVTTAAELELLNNTAVVPTPLKGFERQVYLPGVLANGE